MHTLFKRGLNWPTKEWGNNKFTCVCVCVFVCELVRVVCTNLHNETETRNPACQARPPALQTVTEGRKIISSTQQQDIHHYYVLKNVVEEKEGLGV